MNMNESIYKALVVGVSMICITAVAMWFQKPSLLWWYLAPLLMAGDIHKKE